MAGRILGAWVVLVIALGPVREKLDMAADLVAGPARPLSKLERAHGIRVDGEGTVLDSLVGDLRMRVSTGGYLYSGTTDHERIMVNNVALYFLGGFRSPTRYQELHPGQVTTGAVQEEIVRDLEERRVGVLALMDVDWYEPNGSGVRSGVTFLDNYIRKEYRMVRRIGEYSVWERVEVAAGP